MSVDYLRDRAETAERLSELEASLQMAAFELSAGVALAKALGMTWAEIGEAVGMSPEVAKQGAYQRFGKRSGVDVLSFDDETREHVARLIGARKGQVKYEVRRVVSGQPGVTRFTEELVSRHIKIAIADARYGELRRSLPEKELWRARLYRVHPDGEATLI